MNLAILASHNGSTLDTLHSAIANGILQNITLSLVISNNTDAKVLLKAKKYNITAHVINANNTPDPDKVLYTVLKNAKIDIILLAGYMKKIPPAITQNFKVINSHPALLPKFGGKGMYGRHVHEAVIAANESLSGVTVHEVNENYDEGRIILQKSLKIAKDETAESLEKRIKELEKIAVIEGLQQCLK
ncbi:phosphoribosylglycinamide formyltransferase [Sulfurimonas paralvinellae]|nr:phosphoribosylglycinamide formyltransferase [Sulfurimonas paralvinellae]